MAHRSASKTRFKTASPKQLTKGNKLTLALIFLLATGLSACGGSQTQPPPPPPPPVAQISVSILPASANVAAGGSQQFSATVTGRSNTTVLWEVNGVAGGNAATGTISATGLYTAPNSASSNVISAVAQADQSDSAKANISVLAPHKFGVRTTATLAEFYDRSNGNVFQARGNNYVRLATLTDPNGNPLLAHSTFNDGLYDSTHAESA